MKIYDATEQAYKNGYRDGSEDIKNNATFIAWLLASIVIASFLLGWAIGHAF